MGPTALDAASFGVGGPVTNVIEFPTTFSRHELEQTVADADAGLRLGRPDLALKIIDLTLQLVPEQPALIFRRAVALSALSRFVEAVDTYDRAFALGVDHAEFNGRLRAGRSEVLIQLGRFVEALEDGKKAVGLCPDVPEVLLNHARALAYADQGDAAIDAYDDIIGRHKILNFEHAPVGIGALIAERDAVVRLLLEGAVS
jgi:tetratricopeptide (TPR) repeat protein